MDLPREASTGVIFIIRLLFFGIALTAVLAATNTVLGASAVTFGALIGTALGLAFSRALSNLVSGLYLFGARPFRVGDYIRIDDVEGIVLDVTLNYTRLLMPNYVRMAVPNSKIIDSQLTNFRIRIDDYVSERGIEYHDEVDTDSRIDFAMRKLRYLTKGDEIYRYTFDILVHKDYPIDAVDQAFNALCDEWRPKFVERPEFFYANNENFGVVYTFAVIVKDPKSILTKVADFQTVIAHSLLSIK
jgi:small-conductance mechanosensitive channel